MTSKKTTSTDKVYMSGYDKSVEVRLNSLENKLDDLIKKLERKMTL
jgi:hypothetical protein